MVMHILREKKVSKVWPPVIALVLLYYFIIFFWFGTLALFFFKICPSKDPALQNWTMKIIGECYIYFKVVSD